MPRLTIVLGVEETSIDLPSGTLLGEAIAAAGLPIEQPCAGRGTCGKCKVLVEAGSFPPDEIESAQLTHGEIALNNRLACRARLQDDARVILSPIVVYSNKSFRSSLAYRSNQDPLGLAIDLGSTTVAAFLTNLQSGEVYRGGAALNQQTTFGADVISRIGAVLDNPANGARLQRLALASINQAVDALDLGKGARARLQQVTIVGNVAMHHLLTGLDVASLGAMPFQPLEKGAILDGASLMGGLFEPQVRVSLPPLIGGFVGSDALACLAFFNFDAPPGPLAAIDLGTNGEVMVTDGERIVTASTAAGPAFEGVNISCGSRAIEGAAVACRLEDGDLHFATIGDQPLIGLTGSGLLSLVDELVRGGVIETSGRIVASPPLLADRIQRDERGALGIRLDPDGVLVLSQFDIRELQKAKGAIRAALDTLLARLDLQPADLQQVYLTGSFGGQVDIAAVTALGMLPPLDPAIIATVANGAGLGAALFLNPAGLERAENLARLAQQVDLDLDTAFIDRYVSAMAFGGGM